MSLAVQVLGGPGCDNALFVRVNNTGQSINRLLFDCGDGCPHALDPSDVQQIDHLFFSHQHMDHIGGFDCFFRLTFDRTDRPNHLWGPPGTSRILHHRLRGFQWKLAAGTPAAWHIHDIEAGAVRTSRFDLADAFEAMSVTGERSSLEPLLEGDGFTVEARLLDHGIPSAAYLVREATHVNVDQGRLAAAGLTPGPWLKRVRGPAAAAGETVTVGDRVVDLATLQDDLLVHTPGESIAYLTDFRLDEQTLPETATWLRGADTLVCDCQYHSTDADLAERNRHMTAAATAKLATAAGVKRLVLFHVSSRYDVEGWRGLLEEARTVFPQSTYPESWGITL